MKSQKEMKKKKAALGNNKCLLIWMRLIKENPNSGITNKHLKVIKYVYNINFQLFLHWLVDINNQHLSWLKKPTLVLVKKKIVIKWKNQIRLHQKYHIFFYFDCSSQFISMYIIYLYLFNFKNNELFWTKIKYLKLNFTPNRINIQFSKFIQILHLWLLIKDLNFLLWKKKGF